jgi:hypothetical protein
MSTPTTTVTASNVCDGSGTKLASAIITFTPCDPETGFPTGFAITGGGQGVADPISTTITAGVFSVALVDCLETTPFHIGYLVQITDPNTGQQHLPSLYVIQPTGGTWDFDNYLPAGTPNGGTPIVGGGISLPAELPTSGAIDGTNRVFVFANVPALLIYDGAVQILGVHYTLTGVTVTMLFTPQIGDTIYAIYIA